MEERAMDLEKRTLEELKKGYQYDPGKDAYVCSYCGQQFDAGQIFPVNNRFYMAEPAMNMHIKSTHGGNLVQLIDSDTKYNTLTDNQKELLKLFGSGRSDKEMAKEMGVTEATIRRQRFTFREKAKQAKFYLAVYEQVFEAKGATDADIIPIHDHASYVDDRYLITEAERQHILETSFSSLTPLVLKNFSRKEKKKVVILSRIAEQFEKGRKYSEKEVNLLLKAIYEDYITIRRYLIMYGFMERTQDGSQYWMTE